MNEKTPMPAETEGGKSDQVDQARRRLTTAGMAGSGIILTLASKSVLGNWGTCTGSEIMSGNLSKPGEANPCGCSPGYWGNQNGYNTWIDLLGRLIDSSHSPTAMFNVVFGRPMFAPDVSLWDALNGRGMVNNAVCGSKRLKEKVAFHAVAALLNASVYGSRYPVPTGYQTASGVIQQFQYAFDSGPMGSRSQCAALNDFLEAVDIYDSNNTWCFGVQH